MKTPLLNKKNKYACIYNKHAQNYTKYAQNGAFTNGTPYSPNPNNVAILRNFCFSCHVETQIYPKNCYQYSLRVKVCWHYFQLAATKTALYIFLSFDVLDQKESACRKNRNSFF